MPFKQPWRNYQAGDLFYGLANNRWDLVQFLKIPGGQTITIDEYEISSVDRHHASGLVHDSDFIDALNAHGKYKTVVDEADGGLQLADAADWNADPLTCLNVAKRKCKGGLNWIITNTNRHIHFCLDGLDMLTVPSKSYSGPGSQDSPVGKAPVHQDWKTKSRSITGAELRWVYRNRNVKAVQDKVQFWKSGWVSGLAYGQYKKGFLQCEPPWTDLSQPANVRAAWNSYVPTHLGV